MIATAALSLLPLLCPQAPDDVLARYTLDGRPATVTRTDVALEMAFHLRRRDRGREAVGMLVDSLVTRQEAERLQLMPSRAEVQEFWDRLKQQLIAAGRSPDEFAAVRNTGEKQWLEDLSVQLAQERLVRRELGLSKDEKVSGDMLQLWLGEAKKRIDVETDPAKLPVGTAARVGEVTVPLIDLGMLLLRTSEDFERDHFIRQVAYLEALEARAASHQLSVSAADLDRAIADRRRQAEQNPRFAGISFEKLLEAEGLTVDSLRALRVFRAQVLLDKLALTEFPEDALRQQLADDRDAVLAEVGPRRRIGAIQVRALEPPNALIRRTFADAMAHLEQVRKRIAVDGFAATAALESEHAESKPRGGDLGWHHQNSTELPKEVLKAAFALGAADVSMPIRTDSACYLVTVLDKEPVPSDAELLQRLRVRRAEQLSEALLKDADLQIGDAQRSGGQPK